jgi:hypothetical protein
MSWCWNTGDSLPWETFVRTIQLYFKITQPTLKKISATHVIKLGFAPKAYPQGQHRKTSTVMIRCIAYAINNVC